MVQMYKFVLLLMEVYIIMMMVVKNKFYDMSFFYSATPMWPSAGNTRSNDNTVSNVYGFFIVSKRSRNLFL